MKIYSKEELEEIIEKELASKKCAKNVEQIDKEWKDLKESNSNKVMKTLTLYECELDNVLNFCKEYNVKITTLIYHLFYIDGAFSTCFLAAMSKQKRMNFNFATVDFSLFNFTPSVCEESRKQKTKSIPIPTMIYKEMLKHIDKKKISWVGFVREKLIEIGILRTNTLVRKKYHIKKDREVKIVQSNFRTISLVLDQYEKYVFDEVSKLAEKFNMNSNVFFRMFICSIVDPESFEIKVVDHENSLDAFDMDKFISIYDVITGKTSGSIEFILESREVYCEKIDFSCDKKEKVNISFKLDEYIYLKNIAEEANVKLSRFIKFHFFDTILHYQEGK